LSPGVGARSTPAARLAGWTPFRIAFQGERMGVDWCHLGARRLVEPFFYETVLQAMREPFNLAFQQSTPIEAMATLAPGVPVAGLVFHMSRCGSTLISQALAALESHIVVAEATPLRTVLRALAAGRASPAQATRWLQGLVNAYAQPRFPAESRLFVKFMAADVLDIALVLGAFPDTPWVFVTRDPAEILASQQQSGGIDLMRGQIAPARLGLDPDAMWRMEDAAYKAHALAAFVRAAAEAARGGGGLVLDHAELPKALWTRLPVHFGLALDGDAIARMQAVARRHSKRPSEPFSLAQDVGRTGAAAFRTVAAPAAQAVAALRRATARSA
jgi:hypothetical protein